MLKLLSWYQLFPQMERDALCIEGERQRRKK